MTKFEVFEDKIAKRRAEKRDEKLNEMLALSLETKTHDEVVQELFGSLTIVLGVGNIMSKKSKEKSLVL